MVIDKNYPGLVQGDNGTYRYDGSIETAEDLEINLDGCLLVVGSIKAGGYIEASGSILAGECIDAGGPIRAGGSIEAGECIEAGGPIRAGGYILAGEYIEASGSIEAGSGIIAWAQISAGSYISVKGRVLAGISPSCPSDKCDKMIRCTELRSGEVCYGDLVIIDKEN